MYTYYSSITILNECRPNSINGKCNYLKFPLKICYRLKYWYVFKELFAIFYITGEKNSRRFVQKPSRIRIKFYQNVRVSNRTCSNA